MLVPQNIMCQIHLILYIINKKEKQNKKKLGAEPNPNLSRVLCCHFISSSFCFFLIRIHFKQKSRIELKKKGQKSIQYGTSYINYSCMQCTIFQLEKGNNSLILFTCTVHASIVKSKNQFN